jgi:hypothetical protein
VYSLRMLLYCLPVFLVESRQIYRPSWLVTGLPLSR